MPLLLMIIINVIYLVWQKYRN